LTNPFENPTMTAEEREQEQAQRIDGWFKYMVTETWTPDEQAVLTRLAG
jgi:hypothetical protein